MTHAAIWISTALLLYLIGRAFWSDWRNAVGCLGLLGLLVSSVWLIGGYLNTEPNLTALVLGPLAVLFHLAVAIWGSIGPKAKLKLEDKLSSGAMLCLMLSPLIGVSLSEMTGDSDFGFWVGVLSFGFGVAVAVAAMAVAVRRSQRALPEPGE